MTEDVKRRYDSSRREEQARETRRRILRAAHDLFVGQGYGRTTIAEVARSAGVAVETVYAAYRNKPTLLHRVWDVTVGGDDQDVLVHERPEALAVRAEPDLATRLRRLAEVNTALSARFAPLMVALRGAATTDRAAAQMLAESDRQRLEAMAVHAREAAATGRLAVSEQECRDVLWTSTDGTLWHRFVHDRGWSDERYATWLGEMWTAMLVR